MNNENNSFWLNESDLDEVLDIIKNGDIVQGNEVKEFEKEFARYVGSSYAISVSTGTAGLHVALQALNNEQSSKIITTPVSFISTSNSILYNGSVPLFADVELPSMNIDPDQIEKQLRKNVTGILGVHLYGMPFNIKKIREICRSNDLFLIEDCAQSVGATYQSHHTGTFGEAGVFSFYDMKHLRLGEGGMIVTNNKTIAEKCRMIRSHGASKQYEHEHLGYNFRLNEIFAKIGRIQLKKINYVIRLRRERAKIYLEQLENVKDLLLPNVPASMEHSFYKFPVIIKKKSSKNKLIDDVQQKTRTRLTTGYPHPIYKQPLYKEITKRYWLSRYVRFPKYSSLKCKNAEYAVSRLIELPTDPRISEDEAQKISYAIKESYKEI